MKVALIQSCAGDDLAANLAQIENLVTAAVLAERPDFVLLPEVFPLIGGTPEQRRAAAEVVGEGPASRLVTDLARRHNVVLHGGSLLERAPDGRFFNTTLVAGPDGATLAVYRKIHLFDVTTPDGDSFRESAQFAAGREIVSYAARDWSVGCSICYDVRFPELYQALARRGVEMIAVPAVFTLLTGKDHWEVLLRARAIETECYVLAAGQSGRHPGGNRMSYGHSMVVDPWGHVIARASDGPGWTAARLDKERVARVRQQIPVAAHKVL